jgi:hypothetical protein
MQKISLSSLCISELIENPRPSTHKRRLFSRFARGMIGMHDSTGITASFRQTKTPLNALSNSCAKPALYVPDRGLSLRQRITEFGQRARLRLSNWHGAGIAVDDRRSTPKNEVRITHRMSACGK